MKEAMSEGVIRDFLTVPGIAGVALFGERSAPFFCSLDPAFGAIQKETLSQGILQVVETIPESFEVFEFRFANFWVQLHRVGREQGTGNREQGKTVLLVIAHDHLSREDFLPRFADFKNLVTTDLESAINALRNFEGSAQLTPESADLPVLPSPDLPVAPSLSDFLSAFSVLCDFTGQFLGTPVIVNYLKSCRPEQDWLREIEIARSAALSFSGEPSKLEAPLTPEDHQALREWSHAFIRRCSHVVRNFATLVEQEALNVNQKTVLLGE